MISSLPAVSIADSREFSVNVFGKLVKCWLAETFSQTAGNDSFNEDSEKKGALSKEEFMSGIQFRNTFFDIFPHLICHYSAIIQVSCNLIKVITAGFQVTENLQDFRIIEDYFDTFF